MRQQRMLSLSGLIPNAPPGAIYRYNKNRSPFTSIGVSTAGKDGKTESFVYQSTIECSAEESDLLKIRAKLVEVRRQASGLIRMRLARLSASDAELKSMTAKIDAAQIAFDKALGEAIALVDRPGMMITRAETQSESSLSGKLGSILGLSQDTNRSKSGFAILAGLRTSFLFVGNDLAEEISKIDRNWSLIGRKFPFVIGVWRWLPVFGLKLPIPIPGQVNREGYYIVTSRLESRHIYYAQDSLVEREIEANLKAAVKDLGRLSKKALAEESVEVNAILTAVESLGNVGIIGDVDEWLIGVNSGLELQALIKQGGKLTTVNRSPSRADGHDHGAWQTVYAVFSELDDINSLALGNPTLSLTGFL